MFDGGLAYSFISLATAVLCIFLSAYVFWKNPYLKMSQLFIILTSLGAILAGFDFLLVTAPDENIALLLARATMFSSICAAGSLLYISLNITLERSSPMVVAYRWAYLAIVLFTAAVPALSVSSVTYDEFGWWASRGLPFYLWLVTACGYCLAALVVVVYGRRSTEDPYMRRQSTVLAFGMFIPLAYGIAEVTVEGMDIVTPPLLSAAVLGTSLTFLYVVFKQKLFVVEHVGERIEAVASGGSPVRSGHGLLVENKTAEPGYRIFVNELASGSKGLLISCLSPDQVRERYALTKTPIIWLSTQPGPDRIDPTSLSILQHTIVDFLQKGNGSVILLDGVEHLATYNGPEKLQRLIYTVIDAVAVSDARFIVTLDPDSMDGKSMAIFEREFDVAHVDIGRP